MVSMLSTTGLCRSQFGQPLLEELVEVFGNRAGFSLVDLEAGLVQSGQRTGARSAPAR